MHPIKQMMHHKWSSTEPLHVFVRHACNSIRSFLRGSRRLAMKEWMGSFRVRGRPLFMSQRKREEKIRYTGDFYLFSSHLTFPDSLTPSCAWACSVASAGWRVYLAGNDPLSLYVCVPIPVSVIWGKDFALAFPQSPYQAIFTELKGRKERGEPESSWRSQPTFAWPRLCDQNRLTTDLTRSLSMLYHRGCLKF